MNCNNFYVVYALVSHARNFCVVHEKLQIGFYGQRLVIVAPQVLWASNRLYAHVIPGEMNRATWVFGCISLCLMSEKELVEFIFNTCKLTEAGELELGELDRLAKSLHLSNDVFWPAFSQQLEDIIKSHENGDLIMTLEFFLDMHHKFPMILYPALRVQVNVGFEIGRFKRSLGRSNIKL